MWFKLSGDCANPDLRAIYFENVRNELRVADGRPLIIDGMKKIDGAHLDFEPGKPSCTKSLSVEHLEILLGLRCNFDCEYCSQRGIRDQGNDMNPEKARLFIEHIKAVGMKVSRSIQLWGGEPLVYMKTIRVLVPALREMYPRVPISFPTNGSLLTKGLVDFFDRYRVAVYVSTDGAPSTERGRAVEDDPRLNAVYRYAAQRMGPRFGFGTTPHEGTANAEKIIRFMTRKVPGTKTVSAHNVIRCHRAGLIPDSVFAMSERQKDEYHRSVLRVLADPDLRKLDPGLRRHLRWCMARIANGIDNRTAPGECAMPTDKALVIDWEGKLYSCHSHTAMSESIGDLDHIADAKPLGFTHWSRRPGCAACPWLSSCLGGCPRMGEREHEISCPNLRPLHSAVFISAFRELFGLEIARITAEDPPRSVAEL